MKILTEFEAEQFLEENKFPIVERRLFIDPELALNYAERLGFPVVLKIASDKLLHKSDINAVRLDVYKENFMQVFKELNNIKIEKKGILVQKFAPGKTLLIGLKKDPTFGHAIAVGLGGVFAEVIKDVSFRVVPISKKDALDMLKELKGYEILKGYRGGKADTDVIIDILLKVSKLSEKNKEISELDINPLVVSDNKALVVDARIVFD